MTDNEIKEIIERNFRERFEKTSDMFADILRNFTEYQIERCTEFLIEYTVKDNFTRIFVEEHSKNLANEYASEIENYITRIEMEVLTEIKEQKEVDEILKKYYDGGCTDEDINNVLTEFSAFEEYYEIIPHYFKSRKTIEEIADLLHVDESTVKRHKKELCHKFMEEYLLIKAKKNLTQ